MPLRVYDDRGRELLFIRPPRRVVSLVPSDTLNLFALGAGDRLVGRTRYCVAPEGEVEHVPVVGGTKDVDVRAVAALEGGRRLHHLARDLQAQRVRLPRRRRIAAEALQQIGAVHAGGADAHQEIAGARPRIGDLSQLQHLGPAGGLDDDGAHGGGR